MSLSHGGGAHGGDLNSLSGGPLPPGMISVSRAPFGDAGSAVAKQWAALRRCFTIAPDPAGQAGDGPERTLLIAATDAGWSAAFSGVQGEGREVLAEESASPGPEGDPVVTGIKRAIRAIPAHQRELVGSVVLLVADPSIDLVDSRAMRLRSMDPVLIRQAASEQLGTEASYGFIPFGQSSERELPRGVFAFGAVTRIRAYLSALEMLAPKLVRIVPAAGVLIADGGSEPFAALDLRAQSSTLILADPDSGTVTSREIAFGTMTLAAALAEATSISPREALAGLARRNCLPGVRTASGGPSAPTATARALEPVLNALSDDLKASFDFFRYQRLGGQPVSLSLTGEIDQVQGLRGWLSDVVALPVAAGHPLRSRTFHGAVATGLNLLDGAPDGLLTVGKVEFTFVEGRFRPKQTHAEARRVADRRAADRRQAERRAGERRSGQSRRGGSGSSVTQRGSALLADFQSFLRPAELAHRLKSIAVALPLGLAVCFAGALWLTSASLQTSVDAAIDQLATATAADEALRTSLAAHQVAARPEDGADRYLWTDKLLTIADALPQSMWLTDLSVVTDTAPKSAQRLLLQGAMHASDADRMKTLTSYIERLSADTAFMKDFRAVTFDGETAAQESARGDIVSFKISIWFDEARRRDKSGARRTGGAPP